MFGQSAHQRGLAPEDDPAGKNLFPKIQIQMQKEDENNNPSKALEGLNYTVEYVSCYRGRIEIIKEKATGEAVRVRIVRL